GISRPVVADINRDGLNDLTLINNRQARIEVLLQKPDYQPGQAKVPPPDPEDINDIFARESTWRYKRVTFDLDVAATSLVVADLNGDDWLDLAFDSNQGLYLAVQRPPEKDDEVEGLRQPDWATAKSLDIDDGADLPDALQAGDLNGDGRDDLALLTDSGVTVLLQQDDGTLAQPVEHPTDIRPTGLALADLDGDGRLDLLLGASDRDYPIRYRRQTEDGRLGAEQRLAMTMPSSVDAVRLTEDGSAVLASVAALSGRVQLWTLAGEASREEYPVLAHPLPATEDADDRDVVAADVDGDGLWEVIASDPSRGEFLLLQAEENNSLQPPQHFPGLTDMRTLAPVDVDDDGAAEIVALSVEEKIIGLSRFTDGRLSYPQTVETDGEPLAMGIADVDGDNKQDLVYLAQDRDNNRFQLRTVLSLGTEQAKAGPSLELEGLRDKPRGLRLADVDHDGRVDVTVLPPYGATVLVTRDEEGRFVEVTRPGIHEGLVEVRQGEALTVAPLGEKGKPALLAAQNKFARALVFDPDAGWKVVDQYQAPEPRSNLTVAAACAMGGDAPAIATYDSARGRLVLMHREEDGTYRTRRQVEVGSVRAKRIVCGPFGGEADQSLLIAGADKLVQIPLSPVTHALRQIAGFESEIDEAGFRSIVAGNVGGNDLPDLVLCDSKKHHVEILTFDEQAELISAYRFKVFEQPSSNGRSRGESGEPRSIVVGDVTGDGRDDLIAVVHDRLIVYPQDTEGEPADKQQK
ncbi:MAG: FG-GAP repeat domain-containing protein, partial [Planctomycetota bacterium]